MLTASEIIKRYISFFEARGHKRIANAPLVPINDPTTLFTNSGMQPLIPYLAGEIHPEGKRFVNVQNCFRGQGALDDINEVGNNRHLTFFRMLGNWSLGDYFKKEQLPWMFEFITKDLGANPDKLYVSVFEGYKQFPKDKEAITIWQELFSNVGLDPKERIIPYGPEKNWWSRAGIPENMPPGELGGPDSEIFYDFGTTHDKKFGEFCHINCDCGRFLEISNNVFMEYKKENDGLFVKLPQLNVDHGAGAERLLMAAENQTDVFLTSLFHPVIKLIEKLTQKEYLSNLRNMRMITAHLSSSCFIVNAGVTPSNTEQGYILRRLIRRAIDSFYQLEGKQIEPLLEAVVEQYKETDPELAEHYEEIKDTILEECQAYRKTRERAKQFITKKHYEKTGDEVLGETLEITANDAFDLYTSHGLSPTQIKSLGYTFDEQAFAEKMKAHKILSKVGAEKKFRGGLADHSERTIMGHTATHLLHQALRDVLGDHVHQTGSNITAERVRFDFSYDKRMTEEQIKEVENIVNAKIKENLPVHFELIDTKSAHEMGAIGLFMDTYGEKSKIYFIGPSTGRRSSKEGSGLKREDAYSIEFCGGPHVDFTGVVKSFKIIKQENLGKSQKRIYASVG